MIPTHCKCRSSSIPQSGTVLLIRASVVKTATTHKRIMANERATRSRKLNDRAYRNSENAVIAMPAVKILLIVLIPTSKPSSQPLNMQTFQRLFYCSSKEQRYILCRVILVIIPAEVISEFLCKANVSLIFRLHLQDQPTDTSFRSPGLAR